MGQRLTAIDKAIAQLEGEITVLQLAVQKLKQQQGSRKTAKPRAVVSDVKAG